LGLWSFTGLCCFVIRFLSCFLRSIGVLSQHDVEVGCTVSSWGSEKGAKKSFLNALVNWTGVGLSLLPPCCLIVPKKFSKGSVFNLLVKRNLNWWLDFNLFQIRISALIVTNQPWRHLIRPVTSLSPWNTFKFLMNVMLSFRYSMCDVFSLTEHRRFLVVCNVELLKQ
jgi:hypothetical protein